MSKINYNSRDYKVWYNSWKRFQKKQDKIELEKLNERFEFFKKHSNWLIKMYDEMTNDLLKDFKSAIRFKWTNFALFFGFWIYVWIILALILWLWK